MLIVSVKDKRVRALLQNPRLTSVKGWTAVEVRKVAEMLRAIQVMTHPLQLLAVPSWRAHELNGIPGKWSLMVTANYRLTFLVNLNRQEVTLLDYEDYH